MKYLSHCLALALALANYGCSLQTSALDNSSTDRPAKLPSNTLPTLGGRDISIGSDTTYPPFGFVTADNEIQGFDVDLLAALCELLDCIPKFQSTSFDGIFTTLAAGEFDAVASAITITPERAQVVNFTRPYLKAGQIVTVPVNSDIAGPKDLEDKVVGVQLGTTGDLVATEYSANGNIMRFETIDLAMQALAQGDIDAVITDAPTSADIINRQFPSTLTMVGEPFTSEYYGIAVQPTTPELTSAFNAAIAVLEENGELAKIAEKWDLPLISVSDLPNSGLE